MVLFNKRTRTDKTSNVTYNIPLRRVRVTTAAVEKQ